MFRIALTVVLAIVLPNAVAARPLDEAVIDGLSAAALAAWEVPGAAVIIVSRDQVVYVKGHGVRELGKPSRIDANTIFPLSSCSKAFTSVLISQLADEGKLAWDDPVRKHLPDFHLSDPVADAGVSIRDLLCHRTGVASHNELWYQSPLPQAEIVRRVGLLPASKPFRTTFQYQSVMVTAAGLAAAKAAGKPWEDLIRDRLFIPLGMRTASCVTPADHPVMPHRPDSAGKLVSIPWYEQKEPNAAGSIHVSARDLAQWLMFQLGDGTFAGKRLVSAAGLAETHAPHTVQRLDAAARATHFDTVQMSYALGWVVQDYRGTLLWAHTGLIDGFRVQIALAPRAGFGVAVLANRHQTRMNLALVNNLLDRLMELSPRDWNNYLRQVGVQEEKLANDALSARELLRDRAGKPIRALADFAGRFEHPAYGTTEVQKEGESLVWTWNAFRAPMRYYRGNEFDLNDRDFENPSLTFIERDGKVTGYRLFDVEFLRR